MIFFFFTNLQQQIINVKMQANLIIHTGIKDAPPCTKPMVLHSLGHHRNRCQSK